MYSYIHRHPEKFFYEGLKDQLNIQSNDPIINTYYGNVIIRCVPILDFLNNRYIELNVVSPKSDEFLDRINTLYKYYTNPIAYVYNSLMYYNNKFISDNNITNKSKKNRLVNILKSIFQFLQIIFI